MSPHILVRLFREIGFGNSHSIAGVRSSISPAQGTPASTAKTLLLKTVRLPRPKRTCSRQSGLHGPNSPAQGRPTSTVSYLTCTVQSDRPPAMSPEFPEWPTKLSCVQLWVCACAIGDQPSLSPLIGEDEINSLNALSSLENAYSMNSVCVIVLILVDIDYCMNSVCVLVLILVDIAYCMNSVCVLMSTLTLP